MCSEPPGSPTLGVFTLRRPCLNHDFAARGDPADPNLRTTIEYMDDDRRMLKFQIGRWCYLAGLLASVLSLMSYAINSQVLHLPSWPISFLLLGGLVCLAAGTTLYRCPFCG